MKVGDVIINPYVKQYLKNGKLNPMYKSMITYIGLQYTLTIRIDGKQTRYYTDDVKHWKVSHHIELERMIYQA